MPGFDTESFFCLYEEDYCGKLRYEPCCVDTLEVFESEDGTVLEPGVICRQEDDLEGWLRSIPEHPQPKQPSKNRCVFRAIIGRTPSLDARDPLPRRFPDDLQGIIRPRVVPFRPEIFKLVIKRFALPKATPWLCHSRSPHFQRYRLSSGSSPSGWTGITLRRPNLGILGMDIALSISYNPEAGETCALLLGCSELQTAFISHQLKDLAALTCHPLLLPTLIAGYFRSMLSRYTEDLWERLLDLEHESGITGVRLYDQHGLIPAPECHDYAQITTSLLGLMQLGLSWANYVTQVLHMVEAIQECRFNINVTTTASKKDVIWSRGSVLDERLRFVSHKASIMQSKLAFITGRTQAEMTAIYNFIAQRDAKSSQGLAADSREISAASKRDSSAMKALAVLTMVFLPGTFIAALFSMPIFDWQAQPGTPVVSHHFRIYWAATIPLTVVVLTVWLTWLWITTNNNNAAYIKAREDNVELPKAISIRWAVARKHLKTKKLESRNNI